jgi:hypothetical protein
LFVILTRGVKPTRGKEKKLTGDLSGFRDIIEREGTLKEGRATAAKTLRKTIKSSIKIIGKIYNLSRGGKK